MDKSIEQNLEEAKGLLLEARRNYENMIPINLTPI